MADLNRPNRRRVDLSNEFTFGAVCEEHFAERREGHRVSVSNGRGVGRFRGVFCDECVAGMKARGFSVREGK